MRSTVAPSSATSANSVAFLPGSVTVRHPAGSAPPGAAAEKAGIATDSIASATENGANAAQASPSARLMKELRA
jgi:hypothetical protein